MAAGAGSSSGHGGRASSSAALESSLDRRFQGVSNTMESIQSLSTWCIDNKKHHGLIGRYWMKWIRKSEASHRLNLFYLANDVIQNCKRKNAIVYRSTFAEVLPEAALLVRDAKVRKSVERIFTIWEERNVYPEEFISELKASLVKKEVPHVPVNPKAALKSKIVAEFVPQAFIEQLSGYKQSVEEAELKEKQLSALRVDVCSTEALKRLKDKAGGKKFSKDFEEGSGKLQEFVSFLEQQVKGGPPLLEALNNADVFYEMQYKEVKIVANAYKTFANRVSNLKRKLDALKATLPDPDDSPIPSPSEDAPSPTGSESPFHGMGVGGTKGEGLGNAANAADVDGQAGDDRNKARFGIGDAPSPVASPDISHSQSHGHGEGDNRDVEDMELSEGEETESSSIIVEERREKPVSTALSKTASTSALTLRPAEEPPSKKSAPPATPAAPATPSTPATPLPVNLANVDLGKISSILSSLTSVMKNTGVSPVSRPSPGTPTTPSAQGPTAKPTAPPPSSAPGSNPLASFLSRVDISPEGILSALSKTQGQSGGLQGLSSLLHSVAANPAPGHTNTAAKDRMPAGATPAPLRPHPHVSPEPPSSSSAVPAATSIATSSTPTPKPAVGNNYAERLKNREVDGETETDSSSSLPSSSSPSSLESKIHKFLQGNPGFSAISLSIPILGSSAGGSNDSPLLGSENVDGTPVRDETGGTPTQDEIMDKPGSESLALRGEPSSLGGVKVAGHDLSPTAYCSDSWEVSAISPQSVFGQPKTDGDYRSSHYSGFSTDKKVSKSILKPKGDDLKKRMAGVVPGANLPPSSSGIQDSKPGHIKVRKDGHGSSGNGPSKAGFYNDTGDRRGSVGKEPLPHHVMAPSAARKAGGVMEEGGVGREEDAQGGKEKRAGGTGPGSELKEAHYHRIETVVSSSGCGEGAPIETLGYSNRRMSGERIQTVESIRVIGRGTRSHGRGGGAGARPGAGGGGWYDDAYLEAPPPSILAPPPSILAPPPSLGVPPRPSNSVLPTPPGSEDSSLCSSAMAPPPHLLPPQPLLPPGQFQFEERPVMSFPGEDGHSRPLPHQHPPPTSFFSSPPPPIPQPPPPPRDFLSAPSAVMVGGVLVPVDRVLPFPPARPDAADCVGANSGGGDSSGAAGGTQVGGAAPGTLHGPPPLMSSLLGDPPQFKELSHPGNVKDRFSPCHAPPLHRPGTPGAPPPLLGRVADGPSPPPSSSASSAPPSPSGDPPPLLPPSRNPAPPSSLHQAPRPASSPPSQPHTRRPPSSPLSLMRLPSPSPWATPRPPHPAPPHPAPPQRQFLRGRPPPPLRPPHFEREPLFRGGKRPGLPFSGAPGGGAGGGPFYPPKRPFLPPRY